jgi:hypothetical protein
MEGDKRAGRVRPHLSGGISMPEGMAPVVSSADHNLSLGINEAHSPLVASGPTRAYTGLVSRSAILQEIHC